MTATCSRHEPAWSAAVIDAAPGDQTDRLLIDEGKAFFISTGCDADASVVEVLSGLIRGAPADMLAAR